ncbi:MAG: M61 family metallopeptidase, partial [Planctomycetota bacterium]
MKHLSFHIDVTRPETRELTVVVTWPEPFEGEREFFLPTWTPGSYLLREYSRHLSRVRAYQPGSEVELTCRKLTKNRWSVEGSEHGVELRYRVYAHELTVRTAHVDAQHAYWNHTCLLVWPRGAEHAPAELVVDHPEAWRLSTSLPTAVEPREGGTRCRLRARDLDEALDAPVLVGTSQRREWVVDGVPHAIELDGLERVAPPETLTQDLEAIVRAARDVFGGSLPYSSYTFQALFSGDGYGGLEHRDSSTLLMPRTALASPKGYRDFLGLAAHELFHAWNVKRLRPAEFWEYDYESENYTQLLWVMEGWTAYYDDLIVTRAGRMSHEDFCAATAKNVQGMLSSPGRFELSLEESSFDAWIRLYRPDENTRNSSQNYYGNGAVAAMCLDLAVRRATEGERSLDDVLRALWKETYERGRGYDAGDVERVVQQLAGQDVASKLRDWVAGPLDPDVGAWLADVGIGVSTADAGKPFFGLNFRAASTTVASVVRGGPAFAGEVAPGDEVLALDGLRVTSANWNEVVR